MPMHLLLEFLKTRLLATPQLGLLLKDGEKSKVVVFLNSYSYIRLRRDASCLAPVDFFMCDGMLMAAVVGLWRRRRVDRISFDMTGIAGDVFSACELMALPIAIIGARQEQAEQFANTVRTSFPCIEIEICRDGYFAREDWDEVARSVDQSKARVILVGMGTPLQEQFAAHLKTRLSRATTIFTCGGFIHQGANGALSYYPKWIDSFHLRWLYRSMREPYVRTRLLREYVVFPLIFLRDVFTKPHS